MNKAYPLLRVSSKKQSEEGQGLESQLLDIQRWLENQPDYEMGTVIPLEGMSAYKKKHEPEIIKRAEQLDRGSVLVFTEVSRFARSRSRGANTFLWSLLDMGISIAFTQLNLVVTPENYQDTYVVSTLNLFFEMAENESSTKSFRINNTFEKHLKDLRAGKRIKTSGFPKWLSLAGGVYQCSQYDKDTIKLIFEMKLKGHGCYAIAKHLNANRRLFTGVKAWSYSYVNDILKSRLTLGEYQPYRTYMEDGVSKRKPKGEPITGFYPAVIDVDTFNRVQLTFSKTASGVKSTKFNNVYRGVLRCGVCGGGMSINRNPTSTYLRCEQRKNKQVVCDSKSIRYNIVDERIQDFLRSYDVAESEQLRPEKEKLYFQLEEVTQKITNVSQALAAVGLIPEIQKQLEELTAERERINKDIENTSAPKQVNPMTINPKSEPDRYNAAIRDLFTRIEITANTTKFVFVDLFDVGIPTVTIDHTVESYDVDVMKTISDVYNV